MKSTLLEIAFELTIFVIVVFIVSGVLSHVFPL
jgi:hypothetical protein